MNLTNVLNWAEKHTIDVANSAIEYCKFSPLQESNSTSSLPKIKKIAQAIFSILMYTPVLLCSLGKKLLDGAVEWINRVPVEEKKEESVESPTNPIVEEKKEESVESPTDPIVEETKEESVESPTDLIHVASRSTESPEIEFAEQKLSERTPSESSESFSSEDEEKEQPINA